MDERAAPNRNATRCGRPNPRGNTGLGLRSMRAAEYWKGEATSNRNFGFFAAAVLLHLCSSQGYAQRATASIAGSVTDSTDAAVPDAGVNVRNTATGVERSVVTNDVPGVRRPGGPGSSGA